MRTWDVEQFGAPLQARELPTPTPTGSEVLLRVRACGVCHTDLDGWRGFRERGDKRQPTTDRRGPLPHRLGHEVAGEIVACGPEATGLEAGERRVVFPWIGCGHCHLCRMGSESLCGEPRFIGTVAPGGFADHLLVPHPRYLLSYGNLPEDWVATFACAGVTARGALRKLPRLDRTDTLLVIGAGGIGQFVIALARALYPARIIAVDPDPAKQQAARAAGAAEAIGSEAAATLRDVAAAVDCVGRSETMALALQALRRGGSVVGVGLYGGMLSISTGELIGRRLSVIGSSVGSLADLEEVLALAQSGAIAPLPIATRPMAEASAALHDLESGRVAGRLVLRP